MRQNGREKWLLKIVLYVCIYSNVIKQGLRRAETVLEYITFVYYSQAYASLQMQGKENLFLYLTIFNTGSPGLELILINPNICIV